jgi:hypothetical protein
MTKIRQITKLLDIWLPGAIEATKELKRCVNQILNYTVLQKRIKSSDIQYSLRFAVAECDENNRKMQHRDG